VNRIAILALKRGKALISRATGSGISRIKFKARGQKVLKGMAERLGDMRLPDLPRRKNRAEVA
jgi:hypothetical protein